MIDTSLRTERLLLRAFRPEDLEALHHIWGDPEVIWWGADPDLEATRLRLQRILRTSADLSSSLGWAAVIERDTGNLVGDVFIQRTAYVPDGFELGYHFAKAAQGKGYATEASRALVQNAFAAGALTAVHTLIVPRNAPSLRVAEKLGFTEVGEVMHAGLLHRLFELARPPPGGQPAWK